MAIADPQPSQKVEYGMEVGRDQDPVDASRHEGGVGPRPSLSSWDLLPPEAASKLQEEDWRYVTFQFYVVMEAEESPEELLDHLRIQLEVPEQELVRMKKYAREMQNRKKKVREISLLLFLISRADCKEFRSKNEFLAWRKRIANVLDVFLALAVRMQQLPLHVRDRILKDLEDFDNVKYDSLSMQMDPLAFSESVLLLLEAHQCSLKLPSLLRQKLYASLISSAFATWEDGIYCSEHIIILEIAKKSANHWDIGELEGSMLLNAALIMRFSQCVEMEYLLEAAKRLEQLRDSFTEDSMVEQTNDVYEKIADWASQNLIEAVMNEESIKEEFQYLGILLSRSELLHLMHVLTKTQYQVMYKKAQDRLREEWLSQNSFNPFLMADSQIENAAKPGGRLFSILGSQIQEKWEWNRTWIACLPGEEAWAKTCISLLDLLVDDVRSWISSVEDYNEMLLALKAVDTLQHDLQRKLTEVKAYGGALWDLQPFVTIALTRWIDASMVQLLSWSERLVAQETWSTWPKSGGVASAVELLHGAEGVIRALFDLRVTVPASMVRLLADGITNAVQLYIQRAVAPHADKEQFIPPPRQPTRYKEAVHEKRIMEISKRSKQTAERLKKDTLLEEILPMEVLLKANTMECLATGFVGLGEQISQICVKAVSNQAPVMYIDDLFKAIFTSCREAEGSILSFAAYKIVFEGLNFQVMQELYRGAVKTAWMETHVLHHLDKILGDVCCKLCSKQLRQAAALNMLVAAVEAWEIVVLDGGPERVFTVEDSLQLEADLNSLSDLFYADGEGIGKEDIDHVMSRAHEVVSMMSLTTSALIQHYLEVSSQPKARTTTPANTPEVYVHILCHRKDREASKFLKENFGIPKQNGNGILGRLNLRNLKLPRLQSPQ